MNKKSIKDQTVIYVNSDNEEIELLVSSFFPSNPISSFNGLAVLVQDSAKLKRDNQRIRRNERLSAIGRLSSEIAHEIRNPLSAMGMNLQLLQEKLTSLLEDMTYDKIRNHLYVLDQELKRLTNFLEYFTHISRKPTLRLKWTDVHKVIDSVLKLVTPKALELKIAIKKSYAPALPSIRCDPEQIRQVILNLINNALAAMPDGGVLTLGAVNGHGVHPDLPHEFWLFVNSLLQEVPTRVEHVPNPLGLHARG